MNFAFDDLVFDDFLDFFFGDFEAGGDLFQQAFDQVYAFFAAQQGADHEAVTGLNVFVVVFDDVFVDGAFAEQVDHFQVGFAFV